MTAQVSPPATPAAAPAAGPANGAPAPVVDPKAPPVAPPEPSAKEGQMIAQIRAREVQFEQKRRADARARAEFESYRTRSESEFSTFRAQQELAKTDPLRYLREAHGYTDEALAARILSGGKPTAIEEQNALKRELDELKTWKNSVAQQEQNAKAKAAQDAALDAFHATAKAGADKWPLASRSKESRMKSRGLEIAMEHARQGVTLTDEEVLDKLEEELSEFVPKAPSAVDPKAAAASPGKETSGQDTQPAPTLTNQAAGQRDTATGKVDLVKMSEAEQTAYVLSELKRLRAAGLID